eukprot:gene2666-2966_t
MNRGGDFRGYSGGGGFTSSYDDRRDDTDAYRAPTYTPPAPTPNRSAFNDADRSDINAPGGTVYNTDRTVINNAPRDDDADDTGLSNTAYGLRTGSDGYDAGRMPDAAWPRGYGGYGGVPYGGGGGGEPGYGGDYEPAPAPVPPPVPVPVNDYSDAAVPADVPTPVYVPVPTPVQAPVPPTDYNPVPVPVPQPVYVPNPVPNPVNVPQPELAVDSNCLEAAALKWKQQPAAAAGCNAKGDDARHIAKLLC